MAAADQNNAGVNHVGGLPAWWRCLLVAVATLVLCSCSAPVTTAPLPVGAQLAEGLTATVVPLVLATQLDGDYPIIINDGEAAPTVVTDTTAPFADDPYVVPSEAQPAEISQFGLPADGVLACEAGSCPTANADAGDPYGPIVGPSDEYLCDGGDFGSPAGVRADWKVEGLNQEDAVAHYDTVDGHVVVAPSNRVCIYAPRFAAVRRVVNLMAHEQPAFINVMLDEQSPAKAAETQPVASSLQRHAVAINLGEHPATLFRQRQQAGGLERLQATMDAYLSVAAYANLHIIRTGVVDNAEKPRLERAIQSAITWTGDQAPQVVFGVKMAQEMDGLKQAGIIYQTDEPNSPRLRLVKLASCGHALPGEEIEFTLRFDNVGDQVIGNVTIVDNLSTRLEYIAETATSSVDANFVTEPNDSGSTILRWEIKAPVEPGKGGVLRFKCRVR